MTLTLDMDNFLNKAWLDHVMHTAPWGWSPRVGGHPAPHNNVVQPDDDMTIY